MILFWVTVFGVLPTIGAFYLWVNRPLTDITATVQSHEWKQAPHTEPESLYQQFLKLIPRDADPGIYEPLARKLSAQERLPFAAYSQIKVTNFGNLKATGVTLNWPASGLLIIKQQSGTETAKSFSGAIEIGELRPRHSVEISAWSDRRLHDGTEEVTISYDDGPGTVFVYTRKLSFLDKARYDFAEQGIRSLAGYFAFIWFLGLGAYVLRNGIVFEVVPSKKKNSATNE